MDKGAKIMLRVSGKDISNNDTTCNYTTYNSASKYKYII